MSIHAEDLTVIMISM